METTKLKRFAQYARRYLMEQVSTKLNLVLDDNSAARRENPQAIAKLQEDISKTSPEQLIEKVAYIWFNRFVALRFMDVNRYNRVSIVTPVPGQFQPEVLADAKQGHIDDDMVDEKTRQKIFDLLVGKAPSNDPQNEAYRLLVVAACNYWHRSMPFLFERIADYTELLMPDDLLSGNSILAYTREAMTPDACEDVEVIGWLYQFYISEKKDEVFDGLKKNKKITPENIPAATQLFTPHWIVRYLVENSLGRLWLLNRPGSKLGLQMDYYIKPEQAETDFLRINNPEEIKICDPACGSGHMLTYAFDLLYAIYEEEGYEPAEIPEKILTNNLYGIEIDERAGELAAFALTMKARAKQRRFFSKQVVPNICRLENIKLDDDELNDYMEALGKDLFSVPLQTTLRQFEEADNFGSLIRPEVTDVTHIYELLKERGVGNNLLIADTHQKVLQALRQADYLSPRYHVVIANPPYMSGKGMNERLAAWLKDNYKEVKSDLFSAFIVRNIELTLTKGQLGFMTPFVWMFLQSYEALRLHLLKETTILTLVRPEYHSFFESAYVPVCGFVLENSVLAGYKGTFIDLGKFYGSELQAPKTIEAIKSTVDCSWCYQIDARDFLKIPNVPMAYWLDERYLEVFYFQYKVSDFADVKKGLSTGDDGKFVRLWHEVPRFKIQHPSSEQDKPNKWWPLNKGGPYRRWFGNRSHVVNWENGGEELCKFPGSAIRNTQYYGREMISWSMISSSYLGVRYYGEGFIFEGAGPSLFPQQLTFVLLGMLESKVASEIKNAFNQTLNINISDIANIPFARNIDEHSCNSIAQLSIEIAKSDWNASELSWDFTSLPLLNPDYLQSTLKATYQKLRAKWQEMTLEMQRLEVENNRIFINAYGLQDELTPEVSLNEITLTCNPHYRYGNDKSEDELEALLLADTMRELVSYAAGCMFGRYALDKPGLILANQGETIEKYLKRVPEPSFPADDDNVIPILDGEWFTDDISERFKKFLRVTFGEEQYEDNIRFIEEAIGKDIRKYFLKDFYNDHVKRYKKRPIYWMFSSPRGSFNALIYMHRYQPDTVSIVLNDYLREFRTKLTARLEHEQNMADNASASQKEKTKALKEIEKLKKIIAELDEYERDILYPLAAKRIEIDLDDGVKHNYPLFGKALKKVTGLS